MEVFGLKTSIVKKDDSLVEAFSHALKQNKQSLDNDDIIIFTSKVVALSQGRVVKLDKIKPSSHTKRLKATRYGHGQEDPRLIELVIQEADYVIPGNMLIAFKDGVLLPEAGIDLSNARDGEAILLPKDPWKVARDLWQKIRRIYKISQLGVVISDSHCQPLRLGTTGLALAWAGFEGVEDVRGEKDIYGKKLTVTRKAVADNLASSGLVVMGEAGEKTPFALIRNAPVKFTSRRGSVKDFFVPADECIFGGLYDPKIKKKLRL